MKDKVVLLITPILFHYHEMIKKELEGKGAKVIFFPDQPKGALIALKRKLSSKISKNYYDKIYEKIKDKTFDYFFLINGKGITREFIQKIKYQNNKIKLITYQWDSIARNNIERKTDFLYFIDLFDKCFSFDYKDVQEVKELEYLPTFHTVNLNRNRNTIRQIDFLMVASYTEERYEFIKKRISETKNRKFNFQFHLFMPWYHYIRNLFLKGVFINPKFLKFQTISKEKLEKLYLNSKVTIDIPYKNQSGFTMRVMEGLAYGCKILTTNRNIVKEKFYDLNSIIIFETSSFWDSIEISDLDKKVKPNKLIDSLYIGKWIERIFEE